MGKVFESCIVQIKSVALSNGHWALVKAEIRGHLNRYQ